jgi:glyoxylase I family protein
MAITIEGATPMFVVYDVPTSVAFYRDILGFEVLQTSEPFTSARDDFGWAWMRLNGVDLMLNNAYENNLRPPAPDQARIAAHSDTFLYFACPDVDAAYKYLREKGVAAEAPRVAYYGMKQLNIVDPDGYRLCFQWPAEPTKP